MYDSTHLTHSLTIKTRPVAEYKAQHCERSFAVEHIIISVGVLFLARRRVSREGKQVDRNDCYLEEWLQRSVSDWCNTSCATTRTKRCFSIPWGSNGCVWRFSAVEKDRDKRKLVFSESSQMRKKIEEAHRSIGARTLARNKSLLKHELEDEWRMKHDWRLMCLWSVCSLSQFGTSIRTRGTFVSAK